MRGCTLSKASIDGDVNTDAWENANCVSVFMCQCRVVLVC